MPAYYSVGFQYERAAVRPGFLRDLYSTMLRGDFTYGGVLAYGCRGDQTLEQVIRPCKEARCSTSTGSLYLGLRPLRAPPSRRATARLITSRAIAGLLIRRS